MKIDGKWYHLDVTFDGGNKLLTTHISTYLTLQRTTALILGTKRTSLNALPLTIATYARMPRSLTAFMIYLSA